MRRYRITVQAKADVREIWQYIAERNPPAARRLVARLQQTFSLLASNPLLGQSRDDLQSGLRCFAAGNYAVFYRPLGKGVEIVRVVHGARDITGLFSP
jgi:toxin ParE1/3/4